MVIYENKLVFLPIDTLYFSQKPWFIKNEFRFNDSNHRFNFFMESWPFPCQLRSTELKWVSESVLSRIQVIDLMPNHLPLNFLPKTMICTLFEKHFSCTKLVSDSMFHGCTFLLFFGKARCTVYRHLNLQKSHAYTASPTYPRFVCFSLVCCLSFRAKSVFYKNITWEKWRNYKVKFYKFWQQFSKQNF